MVTFIIIIACAILHKVATAVSRKAHEDEDTINKYFNDIQE